jgi:hypothetical protein
LTARAEQIACVAIVCTVRHALLWSFLLSTLAGWIVPIDCSGHAQPTTLRTPADATSRQAVHEADEPAVRCGAAPWFARAHAPARAPSFVTVSRDASAPTYATRRLVAASTPPDGLRIPLYGLFCVYRI